MCGRSAVLQGTPAIIKTIGTPDRLNPDGYMRLHTDTHGVPSPLPEWAQLVNISWLLTDYTDQEDGPTVLVPGSHRFGRIPRTDEANWWEENAPVQPVPLVGRAGSLAIWSETVTVGDNAKAVAKYPELNDVLGLWHPYPTDRDGPSVPQENEGVSRMMGVGDNIYA